MNEPAISPENQTVINRHGLVATNGALILSIVTLVRMLDFARAQGRSEGRPNKKAPTNV